MLSAPEQQYILSLTKQMIPSILKDIGFDPSLKEPGHSFGEKLEEELVKRLIKKDDRFSPPNSSRDMADLFFNDDLINIKFGYEKKGQPNMVAFNRLVKRYLNEEIDSYWILTIDGSDNKVCLFNLYEHLEYTNTNLGTGQVMLCEKKFFSNFRQDKKYAVTKRDIILNLKEISKKSFEDHINLKKKQEKRRQEMFDAYL